MPTASTMDSSVSEGFVEYQLEPVKLNYRTANSLRQAYGTLLSAAIFDNTSKIVKTKLQVLCASICRAVSAPYAVEFLQQHKDGQESLSYDDFVKYIESEILPKGSRAIDDSLLNSLDKISWTVSMSKEKDESHLLLFDDLFRLWQVFNVIDIDGCLTIDKDEVGNLYEEFMRATGTPWMPAKLEEYCAVRRLMTFHDVVDCLEKNYLSNLPKSLHKEGIKALVGHYVEQQIKSGSLVKKGHRIKSMKERWFVLKPTVLMYFTNKLEKEKKGSITINSSAKVDCGQEGKSTKSRFTVTCGATGTQYEIEAPNQRVRNEWVAAISLCIECKANEGPLFVTLSERKTKREEHFMQLQIEKEERQKQEELIQSQLQELERLRIAREEAEAHAEEEAALLEEERKRREALEKLKAEYELLLEEERQAREDELRMRELQQTILNEEKQKRERLEEIKRQQEELLEQERLRREGLEEESKEKEKLLEEERQRMKELDEARRTAEEAVQQAHAKLEAAEEERRKAAEAVEAAKKKARDIKVPVGLARPIQGGNRGITTHRGEGAFVAADFVLHVRTEDDQETADDETRSSVATGTIEHTPLVKPSRARQTFEGASDTKTPSRIGATEAKLTKVLSSDEVESNTAEVTDASEKSLNNVEPSTDDLKDELTAETAENDTEESNCELQDPVDTVAAQSADCKAAANETQDCVQEVCDDPEVDISPDTDKALNNTKEQSETDAAKEDVVEDS